MTVLILTPLALERAAVLRHLTGLRKEQVGGDWYDIGDFVGQHHTYTVVVRETGAKNAAMGVAAATALSIYKPEIVLLTGICGGVKDVDLGDVVVATKTYNYESGKITDEGLFVARPEAPLFSKELLSAAQDTERENQWRKRTLDGASQAKVVFGPIASGDKVIASTDSELYRRLKQYFNDTTAIEMEAHGFAQAVYQHSSARALNIRGVSDLLDHKSDADATGSQQKAADRAAAFAFELLHQSNFSTFITSAMDTKMIVKEVYSLLFPAALKEIGKDFADAVNGDIRALWVKVRPVFIEEVKELAKDPSDAMAQAEVVTKLKKGLDENSSLKEEVELLLRKLNEEGRDPSISVVKSKNVMVGSNISTGGGDFRLGDTTYNGKSEQVGRDKLEIHHHYPNTNTAAYSPKQKTVSPLPDDFKEKLYELISKGRPEQALDELAVYTKTNSGEVSQEVVSLSDQWQELARKNRMRIISYENAVLERSQIVAALLELIK